MSKRRFLAVGATLSLALLGSGTAMAGSFFGPCLYGAAYYREYPWRTRLGRCHTPPAVCTPIVTPQPPATVEPAPAATLPPPRATPQTPPG